MWYANDSPQLYTYSCRFGSRLFLHLAVQNAMAVNSSMRAHAQCSRTCACIDMTFVCRQIQQNGLQQCARFRSRKRELTSSNLYNFSEWCNGTYVAEIDRHYQLPHDHLLANMYLRSSTYICTVRAQPWRLSHTGDVKST
jgi:hypothetical protein